MAGIAERAPAVPMCALLRHGADTNVRASGGMFHGKDNGCVGHHFVTDDTALTLAVRCDRWDMVEALLQCGVEPDQRAEVDGIREVTALMIAIKNGNVVLFSLLLGHGADAALEDAAGQTALDYVEQYIAEQLDFAVEGDEAAAPSRVDEGWELAHSVMQQQLDSLQLRRPVKRARTRR